MKAVILAALLLSALALQSQAGPKDGSVESLVAHTAGCGMWTVRVLIASYIPK